MAKGKGRTPSSKPKAIVREGKGLKEVISTLKKDPKGVTSDIFWGTVKTALAGAAGFLAAGVVGASPIFGGAAVGLTGAALAGLEKTGKGSKTVQKKQEQRVQPAIKNVKKQSDVTVKMFKDIRRNTYISSQLSKATYNRIKELKTSVEGLAATLQKDSFFVAEYNEVVMKDLFTKLTTDMFTMSDYNESVADSRHDELIHAIKHIGSRQGVRAPMLRSRRMSRVTIGNVRWKDFVNFTKSQFSRVNNGIQSIQSKQPSLSWLSNKWEDSIRLLEKIAANSKPQPQRIDPSGTTSAGTRTQRNNPFAALGAMAKNLLMYLSPLMTAFKMLWRFGKNLLRRIPMLLTAWEVISNIFDQISKHGLSFKSILAGFMGGLSEALTKFLQLPAMLIDKAFGTNISEWLGGVGDRVGDALYSLFNGEVGSFGDFKTFLIDMIKNLIASMIPDFPGKPTILKKLGLESTQDKNMREYEESGTGKPEEKGGWFQNLFGSNQQTPAAVAVPLNVAGANTRPNVAAAQQQLDRTKAQAQKQTAPVVVDNRKTEPAKPQQSGPATMVARNVDSNVRGVELATAGARFRG